jgi:DNA-binding response OmpR family regulator
MPITENPRATILLVDNDLAFTEMLRSQLTARGFRVWHVVSAAEAEAAVDEVAPDLVILDLLLPDTHGLALCANLQDRITAPIMICTGSKRPEDALLGFKLGADDFVSKPVPTEELVARIEVALQRPVRASVVSAPNKVVQVIGPLLIDRARCTVTLGGDPIHLTPTEYRLLWILAERPNHVLSAKELAEPVWGAFDADIRRTLKTHLRRLRAKLKGGPVTAPALATVRGFGYMLAWEPADSYTRSPLDG